MAAHYAVCVREESYLGDTVVDDRLVDGVDEVFQGKHLVRQHLCLGGHALQSVQRVLAHLAHLEKRIQSSLKKMTCSENEKQLLYLFDGNLLNASLQHGLEDGVELSSRAGVVHQLTHVSDDQRSAALDHHLALTHALRQDGNQQA